MLPKKDAGSYFLFGCLLKERHPNGNLLTNLLICSEPIQIGEKNNGRKRIKFPWVKGNLWDVVGFKSAD